MGRKKIVTTTIEEKPELSEIEIPTETPPDAPIPLSPEEQELADGIQGFISGVGMPSAKVTVYKLDPSKTVPVFMGSSTPNTMTEEYIQESWGEGRYSLRLLDEGGRYLKSKTVYIGPAPPQPKNNIPDPRFYPAPAGGDRATELQFELLRSELQSSRDMMLKLIDAVGNKNDGKSGLLELAGVIEVVKGLMPQAAPVTNPASALAEFVDVFKQGIELGASGGTPEKGWTGMLKDVVGSLPAVFAMLGKSGASPAPGNGSEVPAPQPVLHQNPAITMAQRGLAVLKAFARANNDPLTWVDVIVQNLNDAQWSPLIPFLSLPYDEVAKLDPDLLTPVYRPWFERLFNGIREAVSEVRNSAGPGGDGGDVANDGAIDAGLSNI